MLEIIGMGLVALTLTTNIASYRQLFKSKKKLKEEFEASHKVVKENKDVTDGFAKFIAIGSAILNAIFFAVMAGLTGSIWMTALAFLVVALGYLNTSKNIKALMSGEFAWGTSDKIAIPLETIFLVAFIVMFWFI